MGVSFFYFSAAVVIRATINAVCLAGITLTRRESPSRQVLLAFFLPRRDAFRIEIARDGIEYLASSFESFPSCNPNSFANENDSFN